MPKIQVNQAHTLGQEQAIARLQQFLPKLKDRFQDKVSDLQESWQGPNLDFSFKAMGFKIAGKLAVTDSDVKLQQDLPLAAMLFKGKIEEQIREQLNRLLS